MHQKGVGRAPLTQLPSATPCKVGEYLKNSMYHGGQLCKVGNTHALKENQIVWKSQGRSSSQGLQMQGVEGTPAHGSMCTCMLTHAHTHRPGTFAT